MSTLNDDDRANLAAYLDGELDEQTSQALEAKLNRDPEARAELDALRKAWSMLDFLPRAEPSPTFTNRTMERLTLAVPCAAPTRKMPRPQPRHWLLISAWAAVVMFGVTLGACAGAYLWREVPNQDDPIEQMLLLHGRVADHFQIYEPLVNLDFLRSLEHPDLFGEEVSESEPDRPRKQPETITKEGRAQARANARAFLALPAERQQQIVRLDQELFAEPVELRDELLNLAQRFRDWFDQLGEPERHKLLQETDKAGRLLVVKELRDAHWLSRQPRAQRERVDLLKGERRALEIARLREQDRERRRKWHDELVGADLVNEHDLMLIHDRIRQLPVRKDEAALLDSGKGFASMHDLPKDVRDYVNEYLKPMLSQKDKDRLTEAEHHFPLFPRTLIELADRHPPALRHAQGPTSFSGLPRDVRELFNFKAKKVLKAPDYWPGFGMEIAKQAYYKKPTPLTLPHELWPTSEKCLRPPMKAFFTNQFVPALTNDELRVLTKSRGKWPDFPEAIQKLARAHHLQPPWFTWPGPPELWAPYRVHKSDKGS